MRRRSWRTAASRARTSRPSREVLPLLAPDGGIEAERLSKVLSVRIDRGGAGGAVVPNGLLGGTVGAVDLQCSRVVLVDELECVIGGFQEVGTLEELGAPLIARLEDHLEDPVHRLLRRDRPDDCLQLCLVLRSQLDAVLLGECLSELPAGEKTTADEDLAEATA